MTTEKTHTEFLIKWHTLVAVVKRVCMWSREAMHVYARVVFHRLFFFFLLGALLSLHVDIILSINPFFCNKNFIFVISFPKRFFFQTKMVAAATTKTISGKSRQTNKRCRASVDEKGLGENVQIGIGRQIGHINNSRRRCERNGSRVDQQ